MMGNRPTDRRWNAHARAAAKRRVTALLARGMEEYEIIQHLSSTMMPDGEGGWRENLSYMENPKTERPYSQTTINRIIHEVLNDWASRDAATIQLWRGELVGHNKELERACWGHGDLRGVLAAINQRAQLIGGFAPEQIEVKDVSEFTDEERLARVAVLLEKARQRKEQAERE